LKESEAATERLSNLSAELKRLSTEQAADFKRLSLLLDTSERSLKGWRLASLIEGAALVTAAVCLFVFN
jgi:hypothetical protein